ncbi:MAG: hypothetical protein FWH38_10035, partial [Treponema sp.]|nr:hypothetical protein [Treponema sp.]
EAAFLAHQDIALLPGMGPQLMRTATVTGFREIGEIAALGDCEALSLFGKKGLLLRDAALGIDYSPVEGVVRGLSVVPPNPAAYQKVNGVLETVIARYAPAWQNDGGGNLYLDISGTRKLFGPPVDCLCHVLREVNDQVGFDSAAAAAGNKLTCKVASRAVRPVGLVDIHPGDEAAFLAHQDIALLPGMGPQLMRTATVTGFREIGEIAALGDCEALSLFGKKGLLLRDAALGIDYSPVEGGIGKRRILRRADFPEDVIDDGIIRMAIGTLVESAGLEMRNEKLGLGSLALTVTYSDGVQAHGLEKAKRLLVTDCEIMTAACGIYKKTARRRIRIRSIHLAFEDFAPLGYQPDLFEPEAETKNRSLQEAIDRIQNRFGAGKITRGVSNPNIC